MGDSVFVVVTVSDGADNGIPGRTPTVGSDADSIKGPSASAIKVTAVDNAAKDLPGYHNDIPPARRARTTGASASSR